MVNLAQVSPERVPIELLRSHLHRVCGDFAVEPAHRSESTAGAIGTCGLGRFDTALVALTVSHVERDQRAIRRDPG